MRTASALLLVATVLLASAARTGHARSLLGLAGWAFATGFAVNTLGVLTLAPSDLLRLAVFVAGGRVRRSARTSAT